MIPTCGLIDPLTTKDWAEQDVDQLLGKVEQAQYQEP
jgi:hypothetical protein